MKIVTLYKVLATDHENKEDRILDFDLLDYTTLKEDNSENKNKTKQITWFWATSPQRKKWRFSISLISSFLSLGSKSFALSLITGI